MRCDLLARALVGLGAAAAGSAVRLEVLGRSSGKVRAGGAVGVVVSALGVALADPADRLTLVGLAGLVAAGGVVSGPYGAAGVAGAYNLGVMVGERKGARRVLEVARVAGEIAEAVAVRFPAAAAAARARRRAFRRGVRV